MAILKNTYVKKKAIIKCDFLARNDGFVGVVFKYRDHMNYYIFEIGGGDDTSKRFFQIRKRVDGAFSILQRFNTNLEIDSVPFFGYEKNTWYSVNIKLKNENILVRVSLIGTTNLIKVFEVKDTSIQSGRVGFATHQTVAYFSEIFIQPIPIVPRKQFTLLIKIDERELPSYYSKALSEEDPLVIKFFENTNSLILPENENSKPKELSNTFLTFREKTETKEFVNQNNKPWETKEFVNQNNKLWETKFGNQNNKPWEIEFVNQNNKPWEICKITKSPEDRSLYCKKQFYVSESASAKCVVIIIFSKYRAIFAQHAAISM